MSEDTYQPIGIEEGNLLKGPTLYRVDEWGNVQERLDLRSILSPLITGYDKRGNQWAITNALREAITQFPQLPKSDKRTRELEELIKKMDARISSARRELDVCAKGKAKFEAQLAELSQAKEENAGK